MSDSRPMPRLLVIRHGETEWTLNGRHTGRSDIPLTANGENIIKERAPDLVGDDKLLDPEYICCAFVSPRIRASRTFELLFANVPNPPPHAITEDVREWDYGDYEGLTPAQIKEKDKYWSIWRTGCPGGESADQMTKRVDKVIEKVQEIHKQFLQDGTGRRDVLIVSHGHFSRVLISRWVQFPMSLGTHFHFEPAGIAVLSYNHRSLDEPALCALNLNADYRSL
ncbi:phosphoglycerate mutase-like protein [Fomitiporia mediterranea MF3/22]|uniref:phosphoglycerate mutase-like protein n=1 Tax=Fomitiporia mediterranea (strain MF3/22) TaxID=694068 RepID=UPI0004408611|nr:phosphoglycerate mutase-like protein [Fomitiporia mediterranea MF3/22]EJD04062.1 phosphoglycerate mutase-like protein [Fomitiporia mediterranea MF3/22]